MWKHVCPKKFLLYWIIGKYIRLFSLLKLLVAHEQGEVLKINANQNWLPHAHEKVIRQEHKLINSSQSAKFNAGCLNVTRLLQVTYLKTLKRTYAYLIWHYFAGIKSPSFAAMAIVNFPLWKKWNYIYEVLADLSINY